MANQNEVRYQQIANHNQVPIYIYTWNIIYKYVVCFLKYTGINKHLQFKKINKTS